MSARKIIITLVVITWNNCSYYLILHEQERFKSDVRITTIATFKSVLSHTTLRELYSICEKNISIFTIYTFGLMCLPSRDDELQQLEYKLDLSMLLPQPFFVDDLLIHFLRARYGKRSRRQGTVNLPKHGRNMHFAAATHNFLRDSVEYYIVSAYANRVIRSRRQSFKSSTSQENASKMECSSSTCAAWQTYFQRSSFYRWRKSTYYKI